MADPLRNVGARQTPQTERVPGRADQVENNAGGFVFQLDDWARLNRFLILGTEGGTYYVKERKHTLDNVEVVTRLARDHGDRLVQTLIEVSEAGRAPRVNPTLYALAVACASPDQVTRQAAYTAIPRICRTGTHLFLFAEYVQAQRGWGRGLRRAVANWYLNQPVERVAFQSVKYRQREGWSHRDLLRLSHAKGEGPQAALFDFICGRELPAEHPDELRIVDGFRRVQAETTPAGAAKLITEYNLPWEAVPDQFLTDRSVWEAILDTGMGITALMRNLARFTNLGIVAPMSAGTTQIINRLTNQEELIRGRLHPIQLLDALLTYGQGHGARGGNTWTPVASIVDALDTAFYLAFQAVVPANKRTFIGLDVSGSMTIGTVGGSAVLAPREASAAMALVTMATEPVCVIHGFSDTFIPLTITPRQRLDDVVQTISRLPFSRTDCSLPMIYAAQEGIDVDTFLVITDNETFAGRQHPFQALENYRQVSGHDAKLVVVGMTATNFTINDQADSRGLDVAGFDTATPAIISEFSAGRI